MLGMHAIGEGHSGGLAAGSQKITSIPPLLLERHRTSL